MGWRLLKQSTARDVVVGPFADVTDGGTPKVTLTLATVICDMHKGDGTLTALEPVAATPTGDQRILAVSGTAGSWKLTLLAGDTDTLGHLRFDFASAAQIVPVPEDFFVVSADVYNALATDSGDPLAANLTEVGGVVLASADLPLKSLTVINSSGTAITAQSTGGGGDGILAEGEGAGKGFHVNNEFDADTLAATITQAVRDAMKLAPTAGAPAAGSVDEHLDDLVSGREVMIDTTVASASDDKTFVLTAGPPLDGSLVGARVILFDGSNSDAPSQGVVKTYTGSSLTVVMEVDALFTPVATDKVKIFADIAGVAAAHTSIAAIEAALPATGLISNFDEAADNVTVAAAGLDAILMETGVNLRQALSIFGSVLSGKTSGGGTNSLVFKGMNNTTTRVAATTDANGNRLTVTLTLPA